MMWQTAAAQAEPMAQVFRARFDGLLEDEYLALSDRLVAEIGGWAALLDRPRCLWHADFRVDNMLFDAKGGTVPIAVFDWQTVGYGPPALDVSYFVGSGLPEADRAGHEEALVRRYHERLGTHGVEDYSWDSCWNDYRGHAVCGYLGALIGAARAERSERGDRMLASMARRHGRQVIELDAFGALRRD